ncbi:heavy-metal-associated domain-containing protein [Alsobacter sp. R-9]
MCSSHQPHDSQSTGHAHDPAALTMRVEDMTCGHCAGTIKKAIETSLPGTQVHADPASKLVSVSGPASMARLQEIVSMAGYTPTAAH